MKRTRILDASTLPTHARSSLVRARQGSRRCVINPVGVSPTAAGAAEFAFVCVRLLFLSIMVGCLRHEHNLTSKSFPFRSTMDTNRRDKGHTASAVHTHHAPGKHVNAQQYLYNDHIARTSCHGISHGAVLCFSFGFYARHSVGCPTMTNFHANIKHYGMHDTYFFSFQRTALLYHMFHGWPVVCITRVVIWSCSVDLPSTSPQRLLCRSSRPHPNPAFSKICQHNW